MLIIAELCEITISTTSVCFFLYNIPTEGNLNPKSESIISAIVSVSPANINKSSCCNIILGFTDEILKDFLIISTKNKPFKFLSPASSIVFPINCEFFRISASTKYSLVFFVNSSIISSLTGNSFSPKNKRYKNPIKIIGTPTYAKSKILRDSKLGIIV